MYCKNCGGKLVDGKNCSRCEKKSENNGLVLGIISLVASIKFYLVGIITGVIGIVYSLKEKKKNGRCGIGLYLSIGGIVLSFLKIVLIIILFLLFYLSDDNNVNNPLENQSEIKEVVKFY